MKRSSGPVVHTARHGSEGLVVQLHGYGATETQFTTLLPLSLPIVTATPRAPLPVDPGYGWWEPETIHLGLLDMAPGAAVDQAVDHVVDAIRSEQAAHGADRSSTILVGYSQGAALALSVAARRPDLFAGVATAAGFLLPAEKTMSCPTPLDVFIMNGSLDPLTTVDDHRTTVARFASAGHRVQDRIDPVPHVIDEAQVTRVERFIREALLG